MVNNYNKYSQMSQMVYNIVEHLMLNNENIWKVLKYPDVDCLNKPNLTLAEKAALIYKGQTDSTPYRLIMQNFSDDAYDQMQTRLHIFIDTVKPKTYVWGTVDIMFEIASHNKIIYMNEYLNRNEYVMQQLIETLNGQDVKGLGNLFFDYDKQYTNVGKLSYFNKYYQGFRLVMSSHST